MESLKERKEKIIEDAKKYHGPIFSNELEHFGKIKKSIIGDINPEYQGRNHSFGYGPKQKEYEGYKEDVHYQFIADVRELSSGAELLDNTVEIIECGSIRICYYNKYDNEGKRNPSIKYYVNLADDQLILLAEVNRGDVKFPIYSDTEPLEQIGEIPHKDVKATVVETIEEGIKNNKVLGEYADMILGDFAKISMLNPDREVTEISEENIKQGIIESTIKSLEEKNRQLSETNASKDKQISKLQEMLKKSLDFIGKVNKNPIFKGIWGKIIPKFDDKERE